MYYEVFFNDGTSMVVRAISAYDAVLAAKAKKRGETGVHDVRLIG